MTKLNLKKFLNVFISSDVMKHLNKRWVTCIGLFDMSVWIKNILSTIRSYHCVYAIDSSSYMSIAFESTYIIPNSLISINSLILFIEVI